MEKTTDVTESSAITARTAPVLNTAPRIADLRFEGQQEREEIIAADPYANLLVEGFSEGKIQQLNEFLEMGMILPQEGSHPWVNALKQVRQRLRLSMSIHVVLVLQEEFIAHSSIGICHDAGIHIVVGQNFLESDSESELAYQFGVAIWKALDGASFAYREIMRRNCPIEWTLKETILEWGRFSTYSAACYGLLACGNIDTAITESWRHCLGRRAPLDAKGLLALSENYRETGHMALIHLCQHFQNSGIYLVGLPLVLKSFSQSTVYGDLVGGSSATTRGQFQQEIRKLDESLYGLPNQLDIEFFRFLALCSILTRAHVFYASPSFSLETLYNDLGEEVMEKSDFLECMNEMGFGPDGTVDTLELLKELKDHDSAWMIPLFCNEFIVGCSQIIARECMFNPEFQPQFSERLDGVLRFCEVSKDMAQILMTIKEDEGKWSA